MKLPLAACDVLLYSKLFHIGRGTHSKITNGVTKHMTTAQPFTSKSCALYTMPNAKGLSSFYLNSPEDTLPDTPINSPWSNGGTFHSSQDDIEQQSPTSSESFF